MNQGDLTTKLNTTLPSAATKLKNMPQVTPEVMMIVYLDEIAGRLAELQAQMASMTAEGYLHSAVYAATDEPIGVAFVAMYLSLHNDGPNEVYLLNARGKPMVTDACIKRGGELKIDLKTKRQVTYYLVCNTGETASVRFYFVR